MVHFIEGNILESPAQALVNTVNTVGVMGKGIALQFKTQFPKNYKVYKDACKNNELKIGELLVTEDENLLSGKKYIVNFPTKTHWRKPSEYSYINLGLKALVQWIITNEIESIAIPPLGAGNGGLDWHKVRNIMVHYLSDIPADIFLYEPNVHIKEILKKERVKLTPARAMLLSVLYDLVRNGEFVSEFASEKIAYFLQRLGGEDVFKLDYKPNFYGPYSGKVRHVLYFMNGSYIMGYNSKDKKPFEQLSLIMDSEKEVLEYLNKPENQKYIEIVNKAKSLLNGFYSSFGLELLSTIDFIQSQNNITSIDDIKLAISNWSERKSDLFSNDKYIKIAVNHLGKHL